MNTGSRVFVVAGESSGDILGARLMAAMAERAPTTRFVGVGGPAMAAAGLESLFPMTDIAVMGIGPVLRRLPLILRRIRETAEAAIAARPDVLVLIDAPDFCHRVAARVKKVRPDQKVVIYVSPSVWIWRPKRAAKIARFTDRLLALLPFEPAAHRVLGGPPTTYVGHPFIEKTAAVRREDGRVLPVPGSRSLKIVVLPGSRHSEVSRLTGVFGEALGLVAARVGPIELVLPAVDHVRAEIEERVKTWPVPVTLVAGEAAKHAAFREADAALAASGTVTLELALAHLPFVAAYRLDWIGRTIKHFISMPKATKAIVKVESALLPNLILGEKLVPEFIDETCRAEALASALGDLLVDGAARRRQMAGFDRLDGVMRAGLGEKAGTAAADAVLELLGSSA